MIKQILEGLKGKKDCVYVSVMSQNGSTPRKDRARMLVLENRQIMGTIGGGKLEAEAIELAIKCFVEKKPQVLFQELTSEDVAESDMICGGSIFLYLHYISKTKENIKAFSLLHKELSRNKNVYLLCPLKEGISFGISESLSEESGTYFSDLYVPKPRVVLVGAGHVGRATAKLADFLGYQTVVIDDRKEFLNTHYFSKNITLILGDLKNPFENIELYSTDSLVIVTRGHLYDKDVLKKAVQTQVKYIGMIGSRRKKAMLYKNLEAENVDIKLLEQVHCPIGLPLNVDTPEEIALSIMGEIIGFLPQK